MSSHGLDMVLPTKLRAMALKKLEYILFSTNLVTDMIHTGSALVLEGRNVLKIPCFCIEILRFEIRDPYKTERDD